MTHRRIFAVFVDGGHYRDSLTVANVAYELLVLGIALCLAVGLYVIFERPARALLRRLAANA